MNEISDETQFKVLSLINMYNVLLQNYSHSLETKLIFPHGPFGSFIAGINPDIFNPGEALNEISNHFRF
jgi:hypothetical protein